MKIIFLQNINKFGDNIKILRAILIGNSSLEQVLNLHLDQVNSLDGIKQIESIF